jgi:hypothetical protein
MVLGELIHWLKEQEPDKVVRFNNISDHDYPNYFCSWRGVYAELSLTHGMRKMTVGQLLAKAEGALTQTFTGWKGGDYQMDESTPVWADDEGYCNYNAIIGTEELHDGSLTLKTVNVSDYL